MPDYEFRVQNGTVDPHSNVDSDDIVGDDFAEGFVDSGEDTYTYNGTISGLYVPSDVGVEINGEVVDPAEVADFYEPDVSFDHTIEIIADTTVRGMEYDLVITGNATQAGSGDLAGEEGDEIIRMGDGRIVIEGLTGNGFGDTFDYTGTIDGFEITSIESGDISGVTFRIDGEEVPTDDVVNGTVGQNQQPNAVMDFANITYLELEVDASESSDPDGTIESYEWDFGDGSTETGQTAIHSYAESGTYTVVLTVTDDQGATDTDEQTLTVASNQAPTAAFNVTTDGLSVELDASPSDDPEDAIVSYEWDIDGDIVDGRVIEYTFDVEGTYPVELVVTDDGGKTASANKDVEVTVDDGGGGDEPTEGGISARHVAAGAGLLILYALISGGSGGSTQ